MCPATVSISHDLDPHETREFEGWAITQLKTPGSPHPLMVAYKDGVIRVRGYKYKPVQITLMVDPEW